MARQPVQKRAFTRMWLDEQLKAKNIDALEEFKKSFMTADSDQRITLLQMLWDRLYPKARPVDEDGETDELKLNLTAEQILEIAKAARGDE